MKMKKIFNTKFSLALAFASLLLTSCDDKGDATGYSNLIVAEGVVGTINLGHNRLTFTSKFLK